MKNGAFFDNSSRYGRKSRAPSEQLSPIESRSMCETEVRKASTVCPERVRPLASVIVPETMTGRCIPRSSSSSSIANSAALALSVSKIVSTSSKSTPPSSKPFTCSRYEAFTSSNETARYPGSFTSGDNDKVLFIGPMAPATKRGLSGFFAVNSSATSTANLAASMLI